MNWQEDMGKEEVEWQVQGMRATTFHAPESAPLVSEHWWEAVIKEIPQQVVRRPREEVVHQSGVFEGRQLTLSGRPDRVDWNLQGMDSGLAQPMQETPTTDTFSAALDSLRGVAKGWLSVSPEATRLAFGAILLIWKENLASAYQELSRYLPNVNLHGVESPDFHLQINRPRTSKSLEGVRINRLTKWSVNQVGAVSIGIGAGRTRPTLVSGPRRLACRLELDINTAPESGEPFSRDDAVLLFSELTALGREIAGQGRHSLSQAWMEGTAVAAESGTLVARQLDTAPWDWHVFAQPAHDSLEADVPETLYDRSSVTAMSERDMVEGFFSAVPADQDTLFDEFHLLSVYCTAFGSGWTRPDQVRTGEDRVNVWAETSPTFPVRSVFIASETDYLNSADSTGTMVSAPRWEELLVDYVCTLVREAADQVFSDGMETDFSRHLTQTIQNHGEIAVRAIDAVISSGGASVEVAGEILRQIGSMEDQRTHELRLKILLDNLQDPDARIRDAASLGVAALDDPAAIGAIQNALERESSPPLRRNLELVRDQLQAT